VKLEKRKKINKLPKRMPQDATRLTIGESCALNVSVDPLRIADVLEHDLAAMQESFTESKLEKFQIFDLFFGREVELSEDTLGEESSVLVDEQLFGAVDVDDH
jgi:hypothetical protein